jgi:uncharacterized protein YndB with AHSA1/START domain
MKGHLVIADISGYTRFLTDSFNDMEAEHGNGIISDLLNSIVEAIDAPLNVSNIEGDAVFLYGDFDETMTGQTVIESVERLYCAFKSSLDTMVVNTTCTCNACINIKGLGLKIVMHCGEFLSQKIGPITTLSGPDVIMVHRLLKNHIVETSGISNYFLLTDACVEVLEANWVRDVWREHTEEYEHIGSVVGWISNLDDVYDMLQLQTEIKIAPGDAWDRLVVSTKAPPALVWDHIINPTKRVQWIAPAEGMELDNVAEGRVAPGTEFHCSHGDNSVTRFTVLDMRPHAYITAMVEFVEGTVVRYTYYLQPSGSGTRITLAAASPSTPDGTPVPHLAAEDYQTAWHEMMDGNLQLLVSMTDAAALASAVA